MKINIVRSDEIYLKMAGSSEEKRDDIFRWEIMGPFQKKWDLINVPMKAKTPGGYDVVMASSMLGLMPPKQIDQDVSEQIELISNENLWNLCRKEIESSLNRFGGAGYTLPVEEYTFSILLANPDSIYTKLSDGYSGDGGIPGYIFLSVVPGKYTLDRLPAALAHECNHNIRFQYVKWSPNVTLVDMLVCEGLAENYATSLYGEDKVGPWVSRTDKLTLNSVVKPLLKENLHATGFENITPLLYGDEIASEQGYNTFGLPFCAGYACGYEMIKFYLNKTRKSIIDATVMPTEDIVSELDGFW